MRKAFWARVPTHAFDVLVIVVALVGIVYVEQEAGRDRNIKHINQYN